MAFLIDSPNVVNKRVLILKHSEWPLFAKLSPSLRAEVAQKYTVGVYFGYFSELRADYECDFYIAGEGVISFTFDSDKPRLFVSGFNFIPNCYDIGESVTKSTDFLIVANFQPRKNLLEGVRALCALSCAGRNFSSVVIARSDHSLVSRKYRALVRRELSRLNFEQRKCIRYIENSDYSDFIPRELVSYLMSSSRALVIPSKVEGAARVVAEAVLNNMRVVANRDMLGGSLNFLHKDGDLLYSDFDDLVGKLNQIIVERDGYENYVPVNKKFYHESVSRELFIKFMVDEFGYKSDFLSAAGVYDLSNAFSAHKNIIPERFTEKMSDQVTTERKMYEYMCYLTGVSEKEGYRWKHVCSDMQMVAIKRVRSFAKYFFLSCKAFG